MIVAKLIKAFPTEDGITYTLKGPQDKQALHEAVDLQGEDVGITYVEKDPEGTSPTLESLDSIVDKINALTAKLRSGLWHDEPKIEEEKEGK